MSKLEGGKHAGRGDMRNKEVMWHNLCLDGGTAWGIVIGEGEQQRREYREGKRKQENSIRESTRGLRGQMMITEEEQTEGRDSRTFRIRSLTKAPKETAGDSKGSIAMGSNRENLRVGNKNGNQEMEVIEGDITSDRAGTGVGEEKEENRDEPLTRSQLNILTDAAQQQVGE
jgi:hypothetical protein